jgi:transposase
MKILDQLDELNLDSAAKTQVAALVQLLLDQLKMAAETLQAKDLKIQALILELAQRAITFLLFSKCLILGYL